MIATKPVVISVEIESERYTPAFLESVKGCGAWSREARLLLALAAARGIQLDESRLTLADVHDLRALRDTLLTFNAHR